MKNYHFDVKRRVVDGKRFFDVNLSRANIDFLLQDSPELECVSGAAGDVIVRIYSADYGGLPECFEAMPNSEYWASIGVFLDRDLSRSPEQIESDLVEAINSSPDTPMLSYAGVLGNINVGYVRMRVV